MTFSFISKKKLSFIFINMIISIFMCPIILILFGNGGYLLDERMQGGGRGENDEAKNMV